MFSVTPAAAEEIRRVLREQGLDPRTTLRIELPGEDDEGFRWVFRFGDEGRAGDLGFETEGLRIRLDPGTAARLERCQLDFLESTMNRGFLMRGVREDEAPPDGVGPLTV